MGETVKTKNLSLLISLCVAMSLSACSSNDNDKPSYSSSSSSSSSTSSSSSSSSSSSEQNDELGYSFENANGDETVAYPGQIKRHILISDLTDEIAAFNRDPAAEVVSDLNFYFRFDGASSDTAPTLFDIADEQEWPQNDSGELTYGAIDSGKDLHGKIAGVDNALLGDEFFGWETGLDADPTPVELVDYLFEQLQATVRGDGPQIDTANSEDPVPVDVVYVDQYGLDYKQLIQKFLLMSVTFSQGVGDYLQSDFANELSVDEGDVYSTAEHHWDEGFGYFGAARDYSMYTDDEIRAGGDDIRAGWNGYHDSNNDGLIDVRSEYNFGQSTNCAKRDAGSAGNANPTDFTSETFDAFVAGRAILRQATEAGELTADQQAQLQIHVSDAAVTWEKCIAATVVHYINDVVADMAEFTGGEFATLDNFKNLAKHWGEMKGFALGLQFNPESPFRTESSDVTVDDLKTVLSLMGDAPVLPDGTQGGVAYDGDYAQALIQARDILQSAYDFDAENVENW